VGAAITALLAVSCTTITEDLPAKPTPPTLLPPPQIPNPTPTPGSTPRPTPTPNPNPNPTPTPTPNPGGGNVDHVTAGVHSYRRNGQLYRSSASFYKPGDTIYLNCTPRTADGKPTPNHGPIQGWTIYSTDLQVGRDFRYSDTNSFNPDLHIDPLSPSGAVRARCRVDGHESKDHVMEVRR
jgi:hypothetical protein